jgi:hypothetical protein
VTDVRPPSAVGPAGFAAAAGRGVAAFAAHTGRILRLSYVHIRRAG